MRRFLPEQEQREQEIERRLRTDRPAGIYARRSDPEAKDKNKDKSQSREMQTDDLVKWGIKQGWMRELLHEYFADLGLSGTLRPDQRPDMLRLFDDIDAGKYDNGTIICFQENRLFRDETQIYYNQFIDKCLQHNIHVVVISPRLIIYDLRDDLLKEMLRAKLKEAAEFIQRQIKGWLHPARERAAWVYGEWAGLGSLPPGFIVDYDEDSPTYKKPIPYWPHIEKNREMFELFIELGGDLGLFYKRLRKSPIVYPDFESWVDKRIISRFNLSKYPGGGYYIRGKHSLESLLTHPLHYGYRPINNVIRRDEQGNKVREFKPVIEEELLDFAYYRLAKTDFDGNPIEVNSKPRRYFQRDNDGLYGLLKFRILSSQGEVRTRSHGERAGVYLIETMSQDDYIHDPDVSLAISCEEIDTIIVKRMIEHVHDISKKHESVEAYKQQVNAIRDTRQSKIKQLESSINDINRKQAGLTLSLGSVELEIEEAKQINDTEKLVSLQRRKELVTEQIDALETERRKLIQAKADVEKQSANDYGSLDEELEDLETLWPKYDFEKRRNLINFIVKEVIIDSMSTHWLKIQVLWLHEEWGREEMFYLRKSGKRKEWKDEEKEILRANYLLMSDTQLMALLPDKSWKSIITKGKEILGITRTEGRPKPEEGVIPNWAINCSYTDLEFMQEQGITGKTQYTNWVRQCRLPSLPSTRYYA